MGSPRSLLAPPPAAIAKGPAMNRRRVALPAFWLLLICLSFAPPVASAGQGLTGAVDYHDGTLAFAFDHIPAVAALAAIRETTGYEIVLPANIELKPLTLHIGPRPLDVALRHFIRALGLESFALVYERSGPSRQVVVLGPRTQYPVQAFSVPQYIPSTSEPIYIPPADGARYNVHTSASHTVSSDE